MRYRDDCASGVLEEFLVRCLCGQAVKIVLNTTVTHVVNQQGGFGLVRMMCDLDLNECGSLYISVKAEVWVTRGF